MTIEIHACSGMAEFREKGFHEGIQFAIAVIESALLKNPDMPFMVLEEAKKVLSRKT